MSSRRTFSYTKPHSWQRSMARRYRPPADILAVVTAFVTGSAGFLLAVL
jgi:hypothetical protein